MALHRDIYWVGRQWAVTGYGIQACDQKRKSQFDIEASRIWQDGVLEHARALEWLNVDDFEKAISTARKYYPEPPRKVPPPPKAPPPEKVIAQPKAYVPPPEPPNPVVRTFEIQSNGLRAKLLSVWRVRVRIAAR
jgi:hypothetical protein